MYVATNSLGDSAYSNELVSGIGAVPPKPNAPHKDVKLSNQTSTYIYWDIVTSADLPMSGYQLFMDDGLSGPFAIIYDGRLNPQQREFRANGLIAGLTY